jgi:hypothetical protein
MDDGIIGGYGPVGEIPPRSGSRGRRKRERFDGGKRLQAIFAEHGTVESAKVIADKFTGQSEKGISPLKTTYNDATV